MRHILLTFVLCSIAVVGLAAWRAWDFATVAPETPGVEKLFTIEKGDSFESVAARLQKEGLVRDAFLLRAMAKFTEQDNKIRAGEFALNTGWTPMRLLKELATSMGVQRKLVIPEGLTLVQTAKEVEAQGFGTAASFKRAAADPELLKKYGIPAASAEGFLFPETYFFTRQKGDDARYVVEAMLKEFRKRALELWKGEPPQGKELFDLTTLASIVEKETAVPEERERVAGVFVNRLKKNMLLQTDPTIIYGLGEAFDGNLKRSHLDDPKNPYNSYVHPGLPPGPICSPGFASLAAAAHPEEHDLYYFVATGNGRHVFNKTLNEHVNDVNKYQKRGRKRDAADQ